GGGEPGLRATLGSLEVVPVVESAAALVAVIVVVMVVAAEVVIPAEVVTTVPRPHGGKRGDQPPELGLSAVRARRIGRRVARQQRRGPLDARAAPALVDGHE